MKQPPQQGQSATPSQVRAAAAAAVQTGRQRSGQIQGAQGLGAAGLSAIAGLQGH